MIQRPGDAAERAEAGAGEVGHLARPTDGHDRVDMLADQRRRVLGEGTAVPLGRRLVRAEARRLTADQYRSQYHAAFSKRTGTVLAAGTWLSTA